MNDQYGNKVPDDLVLIPNFEDLSAEERVDVFDADWYELNGYYLAVSAKDVNYITEDDPKDVLENGLQTIDYIADILKRGNVMDGFYHA
uniref:Uncharacterized protein n=1 Tax=viral metagenome TaxID=1070528 RepID=A0A6M3LSI5_9ZZZZ